MTETHNVPPITLGHKPRMSMQKRLMRMIGSMFDPRTYLHGLRVLNYYKTMHVVPRKLARIGRNPSISPTVTFTHGEFIELGDEVHLNTRSALWAGPTRGRIVIGDHVLFGPEVFVITSNYRFNDGAPINDQAMDEADVIIGPDVWVGAKSIIMPGSRIGAGAVIGAGSVVRGEIPPFAIAAGNPAKVVGQRMRPQDAATSPPTDDLAAAPNRAVLAIIRREHPTLDPVRLEGPVTQSGLDSFDLMTLRNAIEAAIELQIPDRDWASVDRLVDVARLPCLAGTGNAAASVSGPAATVTTAPVDTAPAAAPISVTRDGRSVRHQPLNMPQMALSGLSESWLFKEVGDIHWAMITAFLKTSSAAIADDDGARLYATFTRILLKADPSLRGFRENDDLDITSRLSRYGPSFYWGDHVVGSRAAQARATTMSTFAKYGERGKNTSLVKGTPTLTDPNAIPPLDTFPQFGVDYRERRAADPAKTIFTCDYDILPPHDINGVGLLYFAAYPTVFDLCLEQAEGKGFLMGHSTLSKDICYFANSEPDETLQFRLHARTEESDTVRHTASLYRSSDGKRMAEVVSVKRRL